MRTVKEFPLEMIIPGRQEVELPEGAIMLGAWEWQRNIVVRYESQQDAPLVQHGFYVVNEGDLIHDKAVFTVNVLDSRGRPVAHLYQMQD